MSVNTPITPARCAVTAPPPSRTATLRWTVWTASVAVLVLLVVASLALGSKDIAFPTVVRALVHPGHSDQDLVVTELRLPRTVLGLLVGAALGVSGALIQAFTRNPLADPGILGVNAGAALFVAVGIAVLGLTDVDQYLWLAFAGAIAATLFVHAVGSLGRGGATPVRLTLAGIGAAAVCGGITSAVSLVRPRAFASMLGWSAGSLTGPPLGTSLVVGPFIVLGLVLAGAISRDLNALGLGDDLATTLGSRTGRTRLVAVVAITLLAGAATAAAGPIGFVGLMVPHVARWIVGPDQRWIFALSLTLGPCLLLTSDVVGRIVMHPAELPVGIVTAFVGAPVLVLLARRTKASTL